MRVTSPRVSNAHKQYLYHMEALNEIPVGALPLHFGPFPVRSTSSSEMASEQKKAAVKGLGDPVHFGLQLVSAPDIP